MICKIKPAAGLEARAYSSVVERIHGMDEVGVRFPVGPKR